MTDQRPLAARIAAAPISWGICEVPGWGEQLPVDRVLGEMADLGIAVTEFGADGWLPDDVDDALVALGRHGIRPIGGFVPLVLHDNAAWGRAEATARAAAQRFAAAGATVFVTCVIADEDWSRPRLDEFQWATLAANLGRVDAICAKYGVTQVLHPHVDSLVERVDEVERVLSTTDVRLCLDTGHLAIGGAELAGFTERWADRVAHVHAKDVRLDVAERLNADELTLMEAVQADVFVPLGTGDVDLAGAFTTLERRGYDGWYVLEQDVALTGAIPALRTGPYEDTRESLAWLGSLATSGDGEGSDGRPG